MENRFRWPTGPWPFPGPTPEDHCPEPGESDE